MKRAVVIWQAAAAFVVCMFAVVHPAQAQISDRVHFKSGPVIMVWDEAGTLRQGDTVSLDLGGQVEMIPFDAPVVTGLLQTVSFTPVDGLDETVSIATNTAFRIEAMSTAAWQVSVSIEGAGPLAHRIGPAHDRASDIVPGMSQTVFSLDQRTAARPGAPRDQSITLRIMAEPTGFGSAAPLSLRIVPIE